MSTIYTDMTGRTVELKAPPRRIISLVPSQTELLYDLGLDEEVAGITKFCVHPQSWFRSKARVGGTKQLHLDKIRALQPDLIIANKEENEKVQVETLAGEFPVWVSDIRSLEDALTMIREIGSLVHRPSEAAVMAAEIAAGFATLPKAVVPRKVAYLIWYRPWMAAGGDTFISNMITVAGWVNVLDSRARYPELTLRELAAAGADLVLLSSEPFPFKEQHQEEVRAALPSAEVRLVDGEMFSWYGSRMRYAVPYFSKLLSE